MLKLFGYALLSVPSLYLHFGIGPVDTVLGLIMRVSVVTVACMLAGFLLFTETTAVGAESGLKCMLLTLLVAAVSAGIPAAAFYLAANFNLAIIGYLAECSGPLCLLYLVHRTRR